jgi:hypothetical protein
VTLFAGQGAPIDAIGVIDASSASGLLSTGGNLAIGVFLDAATTATYIGVVGKLTGAEPLGIPDVTIGIAEFDVAFNVTDAAAAINADWSSLDNAASVAPTLAPLETATLLTISGTMYAGIADNLLVTGDFTLVTKVQDVDDGATSVENALVVIFEMQNAAIYAGTGFSFIRADQASPITGISTIGASGFEASDATLELIIVNDMTTGPPSNSWTAAYAALGLATVHGLPSNLVFSLYDLSFGINNAAGDGSKLDWTSVVGTDASAGKIAELPSGIATFDDEYVIAFGGTAHIEIDNSAIVVGTVDGKVIKDAALDDGAIQVTAADIIYFSVTGGHLFAGVGGSLTFNNATDAVETDYTDASGFSASGANFEFVTVTGAFGAGLKTYAALRASVAEVAVHGLDDQFTIKAYDLLIEVNDGATDKLDWTALGADIALALADAANGIDAGVVLNLGGALELAIDGNLLVFGAFGLNVSEATLTNTGLTTGPTDPVNVVLLTLEDVNLFAGVGGAVL